MPHVPDAPDHTRLWARVHSFELECPGCGRLLHVNMAKYPKVYRDWSRITQHLTCECRAAYVIGVLVWRARHNSGPSDQPPDTRPTRAQLMELRRQATSGYIDTPHQVDTDVNYFVTAECICPKNGWAVACPIHGDHEQLAVSRGKTP